MENQLRDEVMHFFFEQAQEMGKIALNYFGRLTPDQVQIKPGTEDDPVTVADMEISNHLIPLVRRVFGDRVGLLTEESSKTFDLKSLGRKPLIIADELDGTDNYRREIAAFCHILGFAEWRNEGYEVTACLVYNPVSNTYYYAMDGTDAFCKIGDQAPQRMTVSRRNSLETGKMYASIGRLTFPNDYPTAYGEVADLFERMKTGLPNDRRLPAALNIAELAAGNIDTYLCAKAANWDYVPSLIIRQAGGRAYLAKSLDQLVQLIPLSLQLGKPDAYYPAFFTNGNSDEALKEEFLRCR